MKGFLDSIQARLWELGVSVSDVEERFVRGTGPGGQKVKILKLITAVSSPPDELHR
jgi:hypothetical protein